MLRVHVLPAVDFNDQSCFKTNEIQNEIAKWMLTPEFVAIELTTTQPLPQQLFSIGQVAAKCSLQPVIEYEGVCLAFHFYPLEPIPTPALPLKGRGS